MPAARGKLDTSTGDSLGAREKRFLTGERLAIVPSGIPASQGSAVPGTPAFRVMVAACALLAAVRDIKANPAAAIDSVLMAVI